MDEEQDIVDRGRLRGRKPGDGVVISEVHLE